MRLSRTNRAALVVLLACAIGSFGPAFDGSGSTGLPPEMTTYLNFDTLTFTINAWGGVPGGTGVLNFIVAEGPTPGILQVPIAFNACGESTLVIPIRDLMNGYDLAVGVQLVAQGIDGEVHEGPLWALTAHNYVVTDPASPPCPTCPTTPGGFVEFINWPGTSGGPTYPHTRVALVTDDERQGSTPMLALESGPAGSFPIN
jgi:hypothetical protein